MSIKIKKKLRILKKIQPRMPKYLQRKSPRIQNKKPVLPR